jgi:hypothetical protein
VRKAEAQVAAWSKEKGAVPHNYKLKITNYEKMKNNNK